MFLYACTMVFYVKGAHEISRECIGVVGRTTPSCVYKILFTQNLQRAVKKCQKSLYYSSHLDYLGNRFWELFLIGDIS